MERTYRFSLRNETTLFMRGIEREERAEFRVLSLKGGMHFWFRALNAATVPPVVLRSREGKVFGDREHGARLVLRVAAANATTKGRPLPHKSEESLPSFRPGSEFSVVLGALPGADDASFQAALWSFWVAVNLGGYGYRARRGAGSLRIMAVEPEIEQLPVRTQFHDPAEVKDFLQDGLRGAARAFGIGEGSAGEREGKLFCPALSSHVPGSRVVVAELARRSESEEQVRALVMKHLRAFKDPVFGLPLVLGEQTVDHLLYNGHPRRRFRHSSPLWIHLLQTESCWAGVFTVLQPLPLVEGGRPEQIEEFLNVFKHDKKEVRVP